MSPLAALLAVGLVLRLTVLITEDLITAPERAWINARADRGPVWQWLDTLVGCPWCVSVWLSVPIAGAAVRYGGSPWFLVPALAGTASAATGLLRDR